MQRYVNFIISASNFWNQRKSQISSNFGITFFELHIQLVINIFIFYNFLFFNNCWLHVWKNSRLLILSKFVSSNIFLVWRQISLLLINPLIRTLVSTLMAHLHFQFYLYMTCLHIEFSSSESNNSLRVKLVLKIIGLPKFNDLFLLEY